MKKFGLCALTTIFLIAGQNSSKADDLKIYGTESPPTSYMLDGKFTGTTTDIVEGLIKFMGLTTAPEQVPTARANEYVGRDPNVMVFTYAKTAEREKAGLHFMGPVTTRANTLWKKKSSPITVKNLDDVKAQNLTVGAPIGDFRSKFLKDAGVNVEETATSELNLKKLMADRIQLIASSDFEMPFLVKKIGGDMTDVERVYTLVESPSYLMFSKDTDQATLDKWQNAYNELEKTDFFPQLATKWSSTLGINLKFDPKKGLYIQ